MKKKKTPLDYEADTRIDPDALDVEWLRQSNVYSTWARRLRLEEKRVRRAEENIKVVRSILVNQAHKNPALLGKGTVAKGKSPTGSQIEAYYRTHKDHIQAKEELHELLYRKDILFDAVMAIQTKKVALVELGKLALQEYFATPSIPRNLREEFEASSERRAKKRAEAHQQKKKGRNS